MDRRRLGLAEGMASGNQRDGLLVVHRHTIECFTNVFGRSHRIRLAVRPFWIDVDQAHLDHCEGVLKLTFAAVAFVS